MSIIQTGAPAPASIRVLREKSGDDADHGGLLPRGRLKPRVTKRGVMRFSAILGAVVYSLAIWGALFQGVPRVVAWLGQRTASAESSENRPERVKPAQNTPDPRP